MHQAKHAVHEAFKKALQAPPKLAALHADALTKDEHKEKTIQAWLGKLKLLDGIPFNYLVAREEMLPKESIRFFYVDTNWITAIVDGAYSLGTTTYADVAHDQTLAPAIHQQAQGHAARHRAKLLGQETPLADTQGPITGFLLHSMAVSAFPGLEVEGYQGTTTKLNILRMEHLSSDILLCLFHGKLDTLEIHTPPEGLHFGLDIKEQGALTKSLKSMNSTKPEENGCKIENSAIDITQQFYRNEKHVLKIATLKSAIEAKLKAVGYPPQQFTAAEFALQMIEGVNMAKLKVSAEKREKH